MAAKTIDGLIREYRAKRGLTQIELGRALGISNPASAQVMVSRWESGASFPQSHVHRLAEVLGLPKKLVRDLVLAHFCL